MEFGVPQGSVLGPLLFILYINDVTAIFEHCKYYLYADDLVFYASNNKVDLIQSRLQDAIYALSNWCIKKRLTINVEKTKVAWYGSTQKLSKANGLKFYLNGNEVETVDHYTYLGLNIDSPLSFEPALRDLSNKVNHRLFRFSKLRHLMSENCSVVVYRSMILSLFDYGSFCHESANGGLLKKLDRLQKRGLKICYRGKDYDEDELYLRSCLPRLPRRRQELLLTYMFKLSKVESNLDKTTRRAGTRSENTICFHVLRARNMGYTKSPLYRGAKLWDYLGDYYQTSKDKLTFKSRLRKLKRLDVTNKNPTSAIGEPLDGIR